MKLPKFLEGIEVLTGEIEKLPYECKMCELELLTTGCEICRVCGWQDDAVQNYDRDFEGGPSDLSFNQYRSVWLNNMEKVRNTNPRWKRQVVEEVFVEQGGVAQYVNAETIRKNREWREKYTK